MSQQVDEQLIAHELVDILPVRFLEQRYQRVRVKAHHAVGLRNAVPVAPGTRISIPQRQ